MTIINRVIEDILDREYLGMKRYGGRLSEAVAPSFALQNAYEEALDLVIYLRQTMDSLNALQLGQEKIPALGGVGGQVNAHHIPGGKEKAPGAIPWRCGGCGHRWLDGVQAVGECPMCNKSNEEQRAL